MKIQTTKPVGDLAAGLARDAINTQFRLDEAYEQELQQWRKSCKQILKENEQPTSFGNPSFITEVMKTLIPSRMFIKEFELNCRVRIDVERRFGFEIKAVPLNLGYDIRYSTTKTVDSKIQLHVEQVPINRPYI